MSVRVFASRLRERERGLAWLAVLLGAGAALGLLWPLDAPWINDEPKLILQALAALDAGGLPSHGLVGSRGLLYGPFAVWVYGLLLAVTRDPACLVLMKAFLFLAGTAGGIFWLARLAPRLWAPAGALALASPVVWIYARQLWDNTLLIPLSGLAVAAYFSFCLERRGWKILLLAGLGAAVFLTHPMGLAVVLPLAAHGIWTNGDFLRRRPGVVAASLALAVVLCGPYVVAVIGAGWPSSAVEGLSWWRGWLTPWLGGALFSGLDLSYFLGEGWARGPLLLPLWLSACSVALSWLGVLQSLRELGSPKEDERLMAEIALCGLLGQMVVLGLARAYGHPHYWGPGWFFAFYFLWLALSRSFPRWWRVPAAAALGGVLLFLTAWTALTLHRSGGNRGIHYGPALRAQLAVSRGVARYRPGSPLVSRVEHYRLFPHALTALWTLEGLKGKPEAPRKKLAVVYREPDGLSGWLEVEAAD